MFIPSRGSSSGSVEAPWWATRTESAAIPRISALAGSMVAGPPAAKTIWFGPQLWSKPCGMRWPGYSRIRPSS